MDYLNQNNYRMKGMPDPYEGMSDDERMRAGCLQALVFSISIFVVFLAMLLF